MKMNCTEYVKNRKLKEKFIHVIISLFITFATVFLMMPSHASAEETYTITTSAELQTAIGTLAPDATLNGNKLQLNNSVVASKALIYLSNTTPSLYKDFEISFSDASVNLTSSTMYLGNNLTYRGLGSSTSPFEGKLLRSMGTDNAAIVFTLNTTLFNAIKSGTELHDLQINYEKPENTNPVATFASLVSASENAIENAPVWTINLGYRQDGSDNAYMQSGGLIDTMASGAKANVSLTLTDITSGSITSYQISSSNNIGLFCNTMESQAELTVSGYAQSSANGGSGTLAIFLTSGANGSAGTIVGYMGNSAKLNFASDFGVPEGAKITVSGKCSGGIVGSAQNALISSQASNSVTFNNRLWIESNAVGGSAGGIVGEYTHSLNDGNAFCNNLNLIFGTTDLRHDTTQAVSEHDVFGAIHVYNIQDGENYLGSMIGTLIAEEGAVFVLGSNDEHKVRADLHGNNATTIVGGVIGYVKSSGNYANLPKVVIKKQITGILVDNRKVADHGNKGYLFDGVHDGKGAGYFGGVVGKIGDGKGVYVEIDGCSFETWSPWASAKNGFGGVTSRLGENCVVYIKDFSLDTMNDKWMDGCGLIGGVESNSAICLDGEINLSKALYSNSTAIAQLIGYQKNCLIYATENISLTRGVHADGNVRLNDIGNYGSVIRLGGSGGLPSDLFTINETTHKIEINSDYTPAISDTVNPANSKKTITLNTEAHFALYAVSVQSRGAFSVFPDYTTQQLLSLNINIGANIDMTSTGIFSFQRDTWNSGNENPAYNGILDGGSFTVTITPGEAWGTVTNRSTVGDGRLYSSSKNSWNGMASDQIWQHTSIGLFRNTENATIKNLTVDGNIRFRPMADADSINGTRVSPIVSTVNGSLTFNGVTSSVTIDCDATPKTSYIGGFIGIILNNAGSIDITNCAYTGTISVSGGTSTLRFGGFIGSIKSASNQTIDFNNATFSGNITYTGNNTYMYGGGLIGEIISDTNPKTVNINGVNINGAKITIYGNPVSAGGFLGYHWENTNVVFKQNTGITISGNSQITTQNNTNLGGLCYIATGQWIVNDGGIKFTGATISNKDGNLGLLICEGQPRAIFSATNNLKALYLELNSPTSYQISGTTITKTSNTPNKFDELVLRTCTGNDIGANGQSVITIATTGGIISKTDGILNTYQNRTNYNGSAWASNGYSRYYYNLHLFNRKTSGFNDAERMMLWALNKYAHSSLSSLFVVATKAPDTNRYWPDRIGVDGGHGYDRYSANIDLRGYSYYPVDVFNGTGVPNVIFNRGSTIIFDNFGVESADRSTQIVAGNKTQHFGMHCGLFRNVYVDIIIDYNNSGTTSSNATRPEITITGNIGKGENGSGALINGSLSAGTAGSRRSITVNGIVLKDFYINGYTDGNDALLINNIGQYTNVTVSSVYTESDNGIYMQNTANGSSWYAGGSLIGNIGSDTARGIVLQFSDIRLDGRSRNNAGDGTDTMSLVYRSLSCIFKNALFAQSFRYEGESSGTYNFNQSEDTGANLHHVTYGREITDSIKNPDAQIYYNDAEVPVSAQGQTVFSQFAPYIAITKVTNVSVDEYYHEIDVNVKMYIFDVGCGTYAHPYSITLGGQLQTLEKFIISGTAGENLVVRFSAGNWQSPTLHTTDASDVCYIFKSGNWYVAQKVSGKYEATSNVAPSSFTDNVLDHLRSAYYVIENDITTSISGLGTETRAFSGVIIGRLKNSSYPTVTITSDLASGLINVSAGCVVKNLNISYTSLITMTNEAVGGTTSLGKPATYFGGVIGRVIGGDNVIDGVSVLVNYDGETPLGANEAPFLPRGAKSHHITVGGLVGVVNGGGVILRASDRANSVDNRFITDGKFAETSYGWLYCNAYVGRVLDGYVIAEVSSNQETAPNNTNKQYKIPLFSASSGKLTFTNASSVSVSSADALYILSALVNSGSMEKGANGPTQYSGTDYRARGNIDYSGVGTVNGYTSTDDLRGATPYLFGKYTTGATNDSYTLVSSQTPFTMSIAGDISMAEYKNGFCGIGYRYRNIGQGGNLYPNLKIAQLNGNNHTVTLAIDTKSYTDDNFVSSATGLLNKAIFNDSLVQNVTISGNIISKSYDSAGVESENLNNSLGGLAGTTDGTVTLSNVIASDGLTVDGGQRVGGLIGTANGRTTLSDCDCSGVTVKTQFIGGGFVGRASGVLYVVNSADKKISDVKVLDLSSGGKILGGLIGDANNSVYIGNEEFKLTLENIKIKNTLSSLTSETYLGGVIGISYGSINVTNLKITGTPLVKSEITDSSGIATNPILCGGIAGNLRGAITLNGYELCGSVIISGKTAGGVAGRNGIYQNGDPIGSNSVLKNIQIATNSGDDIKIIGTSSAGSVYADTAGSVEITDIILGANDTVSLMIYGKEYVGGIVGYTKANVTVKKNTFGQNTLQNYRVVGSSAIASSGVGGIIGTIAKENITVRINDCYIKNAQIVSSTDMSIGGLVGNVASSGTINGANILLDSVVFGRVTNYDDNVISPLNASQQAGLWAGTTGYGSFALIGVSAIDGTLPAKEAQQNYNGYIIYSDNTADGKPSGANPLDVINSPVSDAAILENSTEKNMYGDGVAIYTSLPMPKYIYDNASTILTNTIRSGYYASLLSGVDEDKISKYSTVQSQIGMANDFSVLIVDKDNENEVNALIMNYIDMLTNGGAKKYFSKLNTVSLKQSAVSIKTYKLDSGVFTPVASNSIVYKANSTNDDCLFSINRGKNDRGENQFTMISVTFSNGSEQYVLQIPVIVDKPVEVTVTIQQQSGTVFHDSAFDGNNNVKTAYGKKVTVRVEYEYGYSWSDFIVDGNIVGLDWNYIKNIKLSDGIEHSLEYTLPKGTRITVIDLQNQMISYSRLLDDAIYSDNMYSINFNTLFNSVGWSSNSIANMLYMKPWSISDSGSDKLWAVCANDETPELTLCGIKYRTVPSSYAGDKYTLYCKEVYYIVIDLPSNLTEEEQIFRNITYSVNGTLTEGATTDAVPVRIVNADSNTNLKIISDTDVALEKDDEAVTQGNVDTFSFYNGLSFRNDTTIELDLTATISEDDRLISSGDIRYMQFEIKLNGSDSDTNTIFKGRVGVNATFTIGGQTFNTSFSTSDGDHRKILIPVQNGTSLINLTDFLTAGDGEHNLTSTVVASVSLTFYANESMGTFPISDVQSNIPNSCVKFVPTVKVSTYTSFKSGTSASLPDGTVMNYYYCKSGLTPTVSLFASEPNKLAVNPGATGEPENGNALIKALCTVDASVLNDSKFGIESGKYDRVRFTLKLYQKQGSDYVRINNIENYLSSITLDGDESDTLVWEYDCASLASPDVVNRITKDLEFEVKRTPVPDENQLKYTSYKVEIGVEFYNSTQGYNTLHSDVYSDHIIYLIAKISELFP